MEPEKVDKVARQARTIELALRGALIRLVRAKDDEFPELNSSHHLKSINLNQGQRAIRRCKNVVRPLGILDDDRRCCGVPIIRLISGLVLCLSAGYLTVKYTILAFRRYWHDSILLELGVKDFGPPDCLVGRWDLEKARRLELEDRALGWPMNDPFRFFIGTPIVLYAYIAFFSLSFGLFGLLRLNLGRIKMDAMGFLFDPDAERLRGRLLLRRQLVNVGESIENYVQIKRAQSSGFDGVERSETLIRAFTRPAWPVKCMADVVTSTSTGDQPTDHMRERKQLFRILGRIWRLDLVKPANLDSEWHGIQIKTATVFLKYSGIALTAYFIMVFLVYLAMELSSRANYRLNLMACYSNMTIPVLREDLEPIATGEDYQMFKEYDGTIVKFIKITLLIEGKYYLNTYRLLSLTEIFLVSITSAIWISIHSLLFLINFLDQIRWLDQIVGQLNGCLAKTTSSDMKGQDEEKLIEEVMVFHLNYSLYKSQFEQFKAFSEMHLAQVITIIAIIMISSHYVTTYDLTKIKNADLVTVMISFLLIDSYLFSVSYLYNRLTNLLKKFSKLLAQLAAGSTRMKTLIAVWRCHQLDDEELDEVFAISYVSLSCISYDTVVKLNIYLMAFWATVTKLI